MQGFGENDGSLTRCYRSSPIASAPLVALIDDDESVRTSLVRSMQALFKVEVFASAEEFLLSSVPELASCVVSDLRLPGLSGLHLQELLQSRLPYLSMVFISGYGDISATVNAMKRGAVDFLEKPIKRSVLLEAIENAIERTGKSRRATLEIDQLKVKYLRLTPREREVFTLVSAGLLNKQVAAQLGTAEKTIKQHRGSIMRKIGADSFADLVVMAERIGIRPVAADFAEARGKLSVDHPR